MHFPRLLCAALAGLLLAQLSAFADGPLTISVGYADNSHCKDFNTNPALCVSPLPAKFPNPWQGSPGIATFLGLGVNGVAFDAGALLLTNTSGADITVSDVTVTIGTQTFDLWGHNFVVPTGQSDILTQTNFDPVTLSPNFDTSDTVPNGADPTLNDGLIPVITITIGAQTFTIHDSNQILNTGGIDVGCTEPSCTLTNESHPWTVISTPQSTVPEPTSLVLFGTALLGGIRVFRRSSD